LGADLFGHGTFSHDADDIGCAGFEFARGTDPICRVQPYEGYYFDNSNSKLTVLKIPCFNRGSFGKAVFAGDRTGENWQIRITLQSHGYRDGAAWLGVAAQAIAGRDDYDFRKPRAIGVIPSIYFNRPEWDADYGVFASDIRPLFEAAETWDLEVRTVPGRPSQLVFSVLEQIPPEFAVRLVNKSGANTFDLRADSVYHFIPQNEVTRFQAGLFSSNKNVK
jgi:hypothetical protein